VIIDGDIVAYRAAFASEDYPEQEAIIKTDSLVYYILEATIGPFASKKDYEVYLTGKGNFRYDIAKTAIYKGNRAKREKPRYLQLTRGHLINNYGAEVSDNEEADDLIGKAVTTHGPSCVVASIDKDMLQLACHHFNITKGTKKTVSDFEGLKYFYSQILSGDSADNIIGLNKVGPITAMKMLDTCKTEKELWDACLKAYEGDADRVIENARLLWLRRKDEEIWEPPVQVKQKGD
jgi:5'-3' exonuclease